MHDIISKGVVAGIAAAAAAVGGGAMYAVKSPADAVSRAEAETIATTKAEAAAEAARTDCRRELATQTANVQASLTRIEAAVTKLANDSEQVKVDVAALKARSR